MDNGNMSFAQKNIEEKIVIQSQEMTQEENRFDTLHENPVQEQKKKEEKTLVTDMTAQAEALAVMSEESSIKMNTTIPCRIEKSALDAKEKYTISSDAAWDMTNLAYDRDTADNPLFFEMQKTLRKYCEYIQSFNTGRSDQMADTEQNLAMLIQVKMATYGYMGTYTNWFMKQKTRYKEAARVYDYVDKKIDEYYNKLTKKGEKKTDRRKLDDPDVYERAYRDAGNAVSSLNSLAGSYEEFFKKVDASVLDGEKEKLDKKLNFMKQYEHCFKTLDIFRTMPRDSVKLIDWCNEKGNIPLSKLDTAFEDIRAVYDKLVFEHTVLTNTKKVELKKGVGEFGTFKEDLKEVYENDITDEKYITERQKLSPKVDDSLTEKQQKGIQAIDDWITRNMFNGGVTGTLMGYYKTDYSALASELLSLTKRERLTIYGLVAKDRTSMADSGAVFDAQDYVPSLEEFKGQMLSSKVFVTKRMTGDGYIAWNKIGEAMRATRHHAINIELFSLSKEDLKERLNERNDAGDDPQEKQDSIALDQSLTEVFQMIKLMKSNPDLSESDKQTYQSNINVALQNIEKISSKYKVVPNDNDGQMSSNLDSVETPWTHSKIVGKANAIASLNQFLKSIDFVTAGVGLILDALVAVGSVAVLALKAGTSWGDVFTEGTNAISDIGSVTASAATLYETISNTVGATANVGSVVQIAGIAAGAFKTGTGAVDITRGLLQHKDISSMQKAMDEKYEKLHPITGENTEEQKKLKKEERYEKGMKQLAGALADRRVITGAASVATGVAMLVAAIGTGGAAVMVGVGVAAAMEITNVGVLAGMGQIQELTFDSYFNLDGFYEKRFEEINQDRKNNDMPQLNDKEKVVLMKEIRKKIAIDRGFSSEEDAQNFIAEAYARKILDAIDPLNPNHEENLKIYVPLIGALGLKYKPEKQKPTFEALKSKMIGQ